MTKYYCRPPKFKRKDITTFTILLFLNLLIEVLFLLIVPLINDKYFCFGWYAFCIVWMVVVLLISVGKYFVLIQFYSMLDDRIIVRNILGLKKSTLFLKNISSLYLYKDFGRFRFADDRTKADDFYSEETMYIFIEDDRKREKRVLNIYNRLDDGHYGPTASFFINGRKKCFRAYYSAELEQYLASHNLNHYIIMDRNHHDELILDKDDDHEEHLK